MIYSLGFLFIITLCGGLVGMFIQFKSNNNVKLLLSFTGAFLLSICVTHLLPEVYESHNHTVPLVVLMGFFLQVVIEFFSQGVEHGHIHHHETKKFPYLVFLGLSIHALTEGAPLAKYDWENWISSPLYWGIVLHKLPIAVLLMTIFNLHLSRARAVIMLAVFALMAPIGGALGQTLSEMMGHQFLDYALAAATGIFLHISTVILFESSKNHRFNLIKFVLIIAAALLAIALFKGH